MRLWSIHPKYLDAKGLVALWREGLLAQSVLSGNTKGYVNHPQLIRFKETINPVGAIASYLRFVVVEADNRAYQFDSKKIANRRFQSKINVTSGQLEYEFAHFLEKLKTRDFSRYQNLRKVKSIAPHPIFLAIAGPIARWEVVR